MLYLSSRARDRGLSPLGLVASGARCMYRFRGAAGERANAASGRGGASIAARHSIHHDMGQGVL